jgi:hypothetical protein
MSKLSRIFAALTLAVCGPLFAATYVVPPDRILFDRADAIVIGHVAASRVVKTPQGAIGTTYDVRVEEIIKGATAMTITVGEPGGFAGNQLRIVPGAPAFNDGERVLLFLNGRDGQYTTTDLGLGAFHFAQDTAGITLAVREEAEIFGWDLNGAPHKEIRRSADGFVKYLREIARAIPAAAAENYAVPARPLQREVATPKMRTTTSSGQLQSDLTYPAASGNSYLLDIELNSGSGLGARWRTFPTVVNWNMGSTLAGAPSSGGAAVQSAFNSWNGDTCSNVNYALTSTTSNTNGIQEPADDINNFVWEKGLNSGPPNYTPFASYSCAQGGLLGLGGISAAYTAPCQQGQDPASCRHTFNGELYGTTREVDVSMNTGIAACPSFVASGNLITAVTHEVGHTLGFRHSNQSRVSPSADGTCDTATMECSTAAVMTATIVNGLNGALQTWDTDAVRKVYASSCGVVASVKGDFSGDGSPDILWRNNSTGANAFWVMTGTTFSGTVSNLPNLPNPDYRIVGTADFNGDGQQDVLWRNAVTGADAIWTLSGTSITGTINLPTLPGSNYQFEGVADFDHNGSPDIIIRNYSTGANAIWMMNGTAYSSTVNLPALPNLNYHIESAADFDANGTPDIVWRNYDPSGSGLNALWTMNGTSYLGTVNLPALPSVAYKISAIGDFNADTKPDIVWRNASTGANAIWLMNGTSYSSTVNLPGLPNASYEIRGPR